MTEFIHMSSNNFQLSRECILSIEKFQVIMQDKESYIAFYERSQIPLCCDAMTMSPCEAVNSHIKEKMGCSSNTNTARQWQVQRLLTKVVAKFMSYDLQTSRLQT